MRSRKSDPLNHGVGIRKRGDALTLNTEEGHTESRIEDGVDTILYIYPKSNRREKYLIRTLQSPFHHDPERKAYLVHPINYPESQPERH
jgi:hypothetical protein